MRHSTQKNFALVNQFEHPSLLRMGICGQYCHGRGKCYRDRHSICRESAR